MRDQQQDAGLGKESAPGGTVRLGWVSSAGTTVVPHAIVALRRGAPGCGLTTVPRAMAVAAPPGVRVCRCAAGRRK